MLATIITASAILSGCSGGGSGSTAAVPTATPAAESASATALPGYLSGTAAVGAPLGFASVNIKDSTGTCASGITNSLGVFSIDAGACGVGPFLIKASSTIGEVSTLATSAGEIVNVTPLTQLISQRAIGNKDLSAVTLSSITSTNLKASMVAKQVEVRNFLKEYAKAVGAVTDLSSVDLIGGSFAANGAGVDKLLDLIKVSDGAGSNVNVTVAGAAAIPFDTDDANSAPVITETEANAMKVVAEAKADQMTEVREFALGLTAIFKNGAPTQAEFDKFVGTGFKHNGYDSTKLLGEFLEDRDIAGIEIRNAVIIDDTPTNFWVAFQIFGKENGKYALWSTWTSKVENPLTAPKLLGNGLDFSLEPGFVKVTTNDASNVSTSAAAVRALRIGAGASTSPSFLIKELNGVAVTNGIRVASGILDYTHTNYAARNIIGLASEYIKINTNEALTPIVKIKYDITGGATDLESYIIVSQAGQEQALLYMDLAMPDFASAASKNCTWNIDALIAAPESMYNITNQNGDFGYANIYLENPVAGEFSYLRASAYEPELLLAAFTEQVEDYVTANTVSSVPPETVRMKAAVLQQYGINDFVFSHVYNCD